MLLSHNWYIPRPSNLSIDHCNSVWDLYHHTDFRLLYCIQIVLFQLHTFEWPPCLPCPWQGVTKYRFGKSQVTLYLLSSVYQIRSGNASNINTVIEPGDRLRYGRTDRQTHAAR
jgi:hypothetical protein